MNKPRPPSPPPPVGRGATHSPPSRHLPIFTQATDDGWGSAQDPLPPLSTVVTEERSRSIVNHVDSPDLPFSASINPYKGCEHGCVYCYARPTHSYLGLSPGLDFESRLVAKPDAPALLRQLFRKRGYKPQPIVIGSNTDPYQPIEREHRITRALLELFLEFKHPVALITKAALVLRDLDLLQPLSQQGLVHVSVSVTTLDRRLARTLEPRAATPARRIETIAALAAAGVPVAVMAAPMIPALNDHELESILTASRQAGATNAGYVFVRLPLELKELFESWLQTHVPGRKQHVLNLIRQARGGQLYDSNFGVRMRGVGPYADLLERRFQVTQRRLGFASTWTDLCLDKFQPPAQVGDQLGLFSE